MLKPSRIAVMAFLVFSVLTLYIFKLMQYQLTDGESYRKTSAKSSVSTIPIIAARGEILDRYGRVLATSEMHYNILIESAFFPSSKTQKPQQDNVILTLTDLLRKSGESWEDSLPISTTKPYTFTGNKYAKKRLVKFINSTLKKKEKPYPANSSADVLMNALKKYYQTQGFTEAQQRTLIGVRYEMYVKDYTYAGVYTFAKDVSKNTITKIQENASILRGAAIQQVPQRYYPDGSIAPHVIGITGRINEKELAAHKAGGYTADDSIGKSGIEKYMESYLRGTNGAMEVEQNANGDVTDTNVTQQAVAGDNVVLTIDNDLQKAVQNEIPQVIQTIEGQSRGRLMWGSDVQGAAAVVMNIQSGEVLAMASYPTYNLNDYRKNYTALVNDPKHPLLNRCIAGTYRPGSTFKPITATAGLLYGIIHRGENWSLGAYFDKYYYMGGQKGYRGSDDNQQPFYGDVTDALARSSNVFFNTVGDDLHMKRLEYVATHVYGIGQKTGIELGGEEAGHMSGLAYDKANDLANHPADAAQAAIGQLYTKISPLQLANYVSTMLRNGKQLQVHIVKQVNNADNTKVIVNNNTPKVKAVNYINQDIVNTVKEGMQKVAQSDSGTAYSIFKDFNMPLGGKTGTAQIGNLDSPNVRLNGLFICFAPYKDPQLAIAVVVEHGHNGYQTAPVARTAIQNYFGLDYYGNPVTTHTTSTPVGTILQ